MTEGMTESPSLKQRSFNRAFSRKAIETLDERLVFRRFVCDFQSSIQPKGN